MLFTILTGIELNEFGGEGFIPLGHYDRVKRQADGSIGATGPAGGGAGAPSTETQGSPPSGRPSPPDQPGGPPAPISPPEGPSGPPASRPQVPPDGSPADGANPPDTLQPESPGEGSGEIDPVLVPNVGAPVGPPSGGPPSQPGW